MYRGTCRMMEVMCCGMGMCVQMSMVFCGPNKKVPFACG